MRKLFTLFLSILLLSCLSESSVEPGNSGTFIRYFNGGNNDEAVGLELTDDGYIILATTRIQDSEADTPRFKIKLIKTDLAGNPVWTRLYPESSKKDFTASSIQVIPGGGGYIIAGDNINQGEPNNSVDDASKALLLRVNANGDTVKSQSFGTAQLVKGRAVALSGANFLLLSTVGTETMYLDEIDAATLTSLNTTPVQYEAGQTVLARRLLVDDGGKAVWAGEAIKNGLTGIRMIRTIPNSVTVDFDFHFALPPFKELGKDFCKFGQQYAVIGTTDLKPGSTLPPSDTDILFKRISENGEVLSSQSFTFDDLTTTGENEDKQNEIGNSINSTSDGGVILLGTVSSVVINGRGDTDYYLIKINAFGEKEWTASFGSRFKDEAVTVRQAPDGGYVTLGTTSQGSLKIISLIKTDKNGNVD